MSHRIRLNWAVENTGKLSTRFAKERNQSITPRKYAHKDASNLALQNFALQKSAYEFVWTALVCEQQFVMHLVLEMVVSSNGIETLFVL